MNDTTNLRVLVIEDDPRMLELLSRGLREIGHTVMPASDGRIGLDIALKFAFDAIVLDIGLPHRDGYEITRILRTRQSAMPILMLTARDAEDDVIRGLDLGADDYLIKPFSFAEMAARLQRLARPMCWNSAPAALVLDPVRLTVLRENTSIQLTRTEFLLLSSLLGKAGEPVSRQSLAESIWGSQQRANSNTLDVLVNALRAKLDASYQEKLVLTVRGIGYRLRTEASPSRAATAELPE